LEKEMKVWKLLFSAGALFALAGNAMAQDPIIGTWKTQEGTQVHVMPCSNGYCFTVASGDKSGASLGYMQPKQSGQYEGALSRPGESRTYSGTADLSAGTLVVKGCAAGLFCQTRTWTRM
jgi:uncharacterized protein (DUF2147 family)